MTRVGAKWNGTNGTAIQLAGDHPPPQGGVRGRASRRGVESRNEFLYVIWRFAPFRFLPCWGQHSGAVLTCACGPSGPSAPSCREDAKPEASGEILTAD